MKKNALLPLLPLLLCSCGNLGSSTSIGATSLESSSEESAISSDESFFSDSTVSSPLSSNTEESSNISSSEESLSSFINESSSDSSSEEESSQPLQEELPKMSIDTEDAAPIVSKEEYVSATLSIEGVDETWALSEETLGIRGRGNYSWTSTEKKSYRIKFDRKINLLGQGNDKAKSWTLLAVHCDKSLLRNHAAFAFASKLGNIPFASSSSFVELTLNGSYEGVYEVCDQIQVGKGRVNIDDSGEDTDIGYLVELDKNASEDVIYDRYWQSYEIKSDYVNEEQMDYIADYLGDCYETILDGDQESVAELIDLPSAVDCYLVEEWMKNLDVGWGSFYFTKPKGGKLYFGPVWDFDLCAGNANNDAQQASFRNYRYTYVGNPYYDCMQQSEWYIALRSCDWFEEMVRERFFEIQDLALQTIAEIQAIATHYQVSFEHNFDRWDVFDERINREPNEVLQIHSFMGQVDYLTNWLTNRTDWLSSFYQGTKKDVQRN